MSICAHIRPLRFIIALLYFDSKLKDYMLLHRLAKMFDFQGQINYKKKKTFNKMKTLLTVGGLWFLPDGSEKVTYDQISRDRSSRALQKPNHTSVNINNVKTASSQAIDPSITHRFLIIEGREKPECSRDNYSLTLLQH